MTNYSNLLAKFFHGRIRHAHVSVPNVKQVHISVGRTSHRLVRKGHDFEC